MHLTEVFNEAKALEEAKEGQKAAEKVTKQSDAIVGKVTKLEVYATEQLSAFNTLNVKSVSVGSPTRFHLTRALLLTAVSGACCAQPFVIARGVWIISGAHIGQDCASNLSHAPLWEWGSRAARLAANLVV